MGVGKSTLGKKLANKLDYTFVDTDQLIVLSEGKSIPKIFQEKGEDYFREKETEVIQGLLSKKHLVVSTGGGLPCFNNLMERLLENGVAINLTLPNPILISRLMNSKDKRPLIEGMSKEELTCFIDEKLQERNLFYHQAHLNFDTQDVSAVKIEALANEISELQKDDLN